MHALKSLSTNSNLTFTCSKLTIKTLERGVKYDQKLTRKTTKRRPAFKKLEVIWSAKAVFDFKK